VPFSEKHTIHKLHKSAILYRRYKKEPYFEIRTSSILLSIIGIGLKSQGGKPHDGLSNSSFNSLIHLREIAWKGNFLHIAQLCRNRHKKQVN
jgi:hypothetical protein